MLRYEMRWSEDRLDAEPAASLARVRWLLFAEKIARTRESPYIDEASAVQLDLVLFGMPDR